mgnify:FL=1
MSRQHDSMIHPQIEGLLERVDSKFSLVTLASYRARQINTYFGNLGDFGHLSEEAGSRIAPPQVSSVARKPLSIAFEEIAADKIVKTERMDYDAMEAEAAELFGEAGDAEQADDSAESDAE